jgi:ketol-acid reductoisomerase
MSVGKEKKVVAVLGYGSQGRAIAQNLEDSGWPVIVGLRSRSRSRKTAKSDGLSRIETIAQAVSLAELVVLALPDHKHAEIYSRDIEPNLKPKTALVFLHGLSVHFGFVTPPQTCDILMLAPHAPGLAVRQMYMSGDNTVSAFYAIEQNHTRRAQARLTEFAGAIGFAPDQLVKTTFEAEALGDIFGEQAVLCGGLAMLIKHGFETLLEKGHKPDHAYLEVAYQLDLIVDLIKQYGIEGMLERVSVAARFGAVKSGPRLIDASVKKRMKAVYDQVSSGKFARRLSKLTDSELAVLSKEIKKLSHPALERAAKKRAR